MPVPVVIDTNIYLSHLMRPGSVPSRTLLRVWRLDLPLVSRETLAELASTLRKPKLAKYFRPADVDAFLVGVGEVSTRIEVQSRFNVCRHFKDDKFLELAVDGRADLILSGDRDLLALHPFRGILVVTPTRYLAED